MKISHFSNDVLQIDPQKEVDKICLRLKHILAKKLKRRGLVIGMSGGIDSSVSAAIAVRATGGKKTLGLLMPEQHSDDETHKLSNMVADFLGVQKIQENISGLLKSAGFYERYEEAVRSVIPEYSASWKSKLVISNIFESNRFNLFSIVAQKPDGSLIKKRLPLNAYLEIVAATNFKQRIRKMLEYYHADRLNYAVVGTPNRLEYDQGFFVKLGDGAADVKPIAHLYKTQVYQIAEYLDIPEEIRKRTPTTDTYSLSQGQDEFYFSLPYDKMDLCLYGKNNGISAEAVAEFVKITPQQVQRVYDDIDAKRRATRYLHLPPILIEDIQEIDAQH
jgi:NAD+ synthase